MLLVWEFKCIQHCCFGKMLHMWTRAYSCFNLHSMFWHITYTVLHTMNTHKYITIIHRSWLAILQQFENRQSKIPIINRCVVVNIFVWKMYLPLCWSLFHVAQRFRQDTWEMGLKVLELKMKFTHYAQLWFECDLSAAYTFNLWNSKFTTVV